MIVTEIRLRDLNTTIVFVLVEIHLSRTTNEMICLVWPFSTSIELLFTAVLAVNNKRFFVVHGDSERCEMFFLYSVFIQSTGMRSNSIRSNSITRYNKSFFS